MLLDKWKVSHFLRFREYLDSPDSLAEETTHSILRRLRVPAMLVQRLSLSTWDKLVRIVMLILEHPLLRVSWTQIMRV